MDKPVDQLSIIIEDLTLMVVSQEITTSVGVCLSYDMFFELDLIVCLFQQCHYDVTLQKPSGVCNAW